MSQDKLGVLDRRIFMKTALISGAALTAGLPTRSLLAAGKAPERSDQLAPPSSVRQILPEVNPPNTTRIVFASWGEIRMRLHGRFAATSVEPCPLICVQIGVAAVALTEDDTSPSS